MPAPRPSRTPSSSRGPTPAATAVIGFEGAFHGRTYLSLALTSKTHPYKAGLGPFAPEVYRVPYPNAFRGPSAAEALAALRRAFSTLVAAEDVAAIVVRAGAGRGRVHRRATLEFVQGLREICDEHGIVFVLRRGPERLRPHRPLLRDRALRSRARPDHGRQVDRDGDPALGRARQGRDHGCARRGRRRRHVCRQPGRPGAAAVAVLDGRVHDLGLAEHARERDPRGRDAASRP